jgi:hypothetical protein
MTTSAPPYPITDSPFEAERIGRAGTPAERWYVGERCPAGCRVIVVDGRDAHPLRARTHDPLRSFSWGRSGSSARELAWSMLYDSAHDPGLADDWASAFTAEVISLLPPDAFRIASSDVIAWLADERLTGATDRLLRHGSVAGDPRIGEGPPGHHPPARGTADQPADDHHRDRAGTPT